MSKLKRNPHYLYPGDIIRLVDAGIDTTIAHYTEKHGCIFKVDTYDYLGVGNSFRHVVTLISIATGDTIRECLTRHEFRVITRSKYDEHQEHDKGNCSISGQPVHPDSLQAEAQRGAGQGTSSSNATGR